MHRAPADGRRQAAARAARPSGRLGVTRP
jgi:hypothetical protein